MDGKVCVCVFIGAGGVPTLSRKSNKRRPWRRPVFPSDGPLTLGAGGSLPALLADAGE